MEFPRPLQTVSDLRPAAVPSQLRPPAPSCTKEGRPVAKLACAAASGILQLARCQRRRVLRAAREDDHAVAVRNWLQKLVIGMNFCPWAKSVNEDNGIKVVTSLATTEDEVLSDLKREAAWLPVGEAKTKPTTTLVVCPYVAPWQVASLVAPIPRALERVPWSEDFGGHEEGHSTLWGNGPSSQWCLFTSCWRRTKPTSPCFLQPTVSGQIVASSEEKQAPSLKSFFPVCDFVICPDGRVL
ncbi:unnamed protein product [Effrenium voratum]|nr:unnamed protein product [Effrenium voratum]